MDDLVRLAIKKWPNVPHCYGWLALDARGNFRMRDEAAQANNLRGDPIRHAALLAFIHRNYAQDANAAWYFQNGPQRVYVDLEATPFIARTDHGGRLLLHDGSALQSLTQVWMTEHGQLIVQDATHVAMVDDRDVAQCLSLLRWQGQAIADEQLLDWLTTPDHYLHWMAGEAAVPVKAIAYAELHSKLGFVSRPRQAD